MKYLKLFFVYVILQIEHEEGRCFFRSLVEQLLRSEHRCHGKGGTSLKVWVAKCLYCPRAY